MTVHGNTKAPVELVRALASEGLSQATTAVALGVSRERIRQIANREGIDFLPGNVNWDLHEKVAELNAQGLCDRDIAEQLRESYQSVRFARIHSGLPYIKPAPRWKHESAIREMAAKGMTVGEVASALGISQPNVSRIKAKFNIKFVDGRSKRFGK